MMHGQKNIKFKLLYANLPLRPMASFRLRS